MASTTSAADDGPEDALLTELRARGACMDVVPRERPDGVRGIFATRDLDKEDIACWVPDECVLELSTCDAELREAIEATLGDAKLAEIELQVYGKMIALAAGYLLEKSRGTASTYHRYIQALPSHPPTVNKFSAEERDALRLLSGSDVFSTYQSLVDLTTVCVQRAAGLWPAGAPERCSVEDAFFFVLSRMSYMRLIPVCDLANAALPGEENARIAVEQEADGRKGCAVVTKRPVTAGEELVIDYNHHDALGMLAAYGCTLGMERTRSVTRVEVAAPPFLKDLAGGAEKYQLLEDEPDVLPAKAMTVLRLASLGSEEDILLAAETGYFKGARASGLPPEKYTKWCTLEARMYAEIARFCSEQLLALEARAGAALGSLRDDSSISSALRTQYETDRRLLLRCKQVMGQKAAARLQTGRTEPQQNNNQPVDG